MQIDTGGFDQFTFNPTTVNAILHRERNSDSREIGWWAEFKELKLGRLYVHVQWYFQITNTACKQSWYALGSQSQMRWHFPFRESKKSKK